MKLQQALSVLANAMRDAEPPESGDDDEREIAHSDVPRPLGFFNKKPAGIVANAADDAPLGPPRAVLLAPPDKKRKEAA